MVFIAIQPQYDGSFAVIVAFASIALVVTHASQYIGYVGNRLLLVFVQYL